MTLTKYTKSGLFIYRTAARWPGTVPLNENDGFETVLTIVSGKLETMKQAKAGDIVIRNIILGGSAETYIMSKEKFENRYSVVDNTSLFIDGYLWYKATAKGQVFASMYKGDTFKFTASWGEEMICNDGDYIARPVDGDINDVYRIEKDAFDKTYTKTL